MKMNVFTISSFEQLNEEMGKIGTTREIVLCGDLTSTVRERTNDEVV